MKQLSYKGAAIEVYQRPGVNAPMSIHIDDAVEADIEIKGIEVFDAVALAKTVVDTVLNNNAVVGVDFDGTGSNGNGSKVAG